MKLLKGLYGWVTGGSDTANKVVISGVDMLDNAFFTDQEKATGHQKILDWFLKYQQATAPQNVARRIIAVQVVTLWTVLVSLTVFFHVVHLYSSSEFIFSVLKEVVAVPFAIVIGFYFAAHVVRAAVQK